MSVWHEVSEPLSRELHMLPPERKVVLLWLSGKYLPFCGYLRYAAGCVDSPYFVVYGVVERSPVVAWRDCLPEVGPEIPEAEMYGRDQSRGGRGFPASYPQVVDLS